MVTKELGLLSIATSELIGEHLLQADVKSGAKLVLAYSGGVDSEVLLHGLAEFATQNNDYRYLIIHVHHGLSDDADDWVNHCQQQALSYNLPLQVEYVHINTGPRKSIEAEARNARYDAIKAHMEPGDVLLTAHHLDDQLETVLLALKRGLGPKGLSAMGEIQPFDHDKQLIRPLLSISREQIESHASQLALIHISDESNGDDRYDRNFLRLDIIPKLKARWSSIAVTASRSARLCAQQQAVIEREVSKRLPQFIETSLSGVVGLDLAMLANEDNHWQALLFRGLVEKCGFSMPSQAQLTQILSQLLMAKQDAQIELKFGDLLIRRYQGKAFLFSMSTQSRRLVLQDVFELDRSQLLAEGHTKINISLAVSLIIQQQQLDNRVRLPSPGERVSIRFGVTGSTRCQPDGRAKGRELKKLWQEFALPTWERDKTPLIFYNERLVCAVGYWIETGFQCTANEPGLFFAQQDS